MTTPAVRAAEERAEAARLAYLAAEAAAKDAVKAAKAKWNAALDAVSAARFDAVNPPMFATTTDVSGAWDGFQVVSDADPGL